MDTNSSEGGASESFDESTDEEDDTRALLSDWAVRKQIPHSSLTELLKILCNKLPELGLPKDSQTLLKTKSVVEMKEVSGGTYFHAGIEQSVVSPHNISSSNVSVSVPASQYRWPSSIQELKLSILAYFRPNRKLQ